MPVIFVSRDDVVFANDRHLGVGDMLQYEDLCQLVAQCDVLTVDACHDAPTALIASRQARKASTPQDAMLGNLLLVFALLILTAAVIFHALTCR